jgi:hypothetical protein
LITSLQLALGMTVFSAAACLITASVTSDLAAQAAVLFSALIAIFNGLSALLLSHLGSKRQSLKAFFGAIFGGMVLRMGVTLAGLAVGLKVFALPVAPFAVALLTFTGLFTAAEVTFWYRQTSSSRVQLS